MATGIRNKIAANSALAGQATSQDVVVPATAQAGDIAIAVSSNSNGEVMTLTQTGWTPYAQEAIGTTGARAWSKTLTATDAGSTVGFTQAIGARLALGLIVVSGGASLSAPVLRNEPVADTTLIIPAITPTAADSMLIVVSGIRHSQIAGPGIALPAGSVWNEEFDSATTNTTGTHSGVWAASRQMTGGAGVATNTVTATSTGPTGEATWLFEITPGVESPYVVGFTYQIVNNVWT